MKRDHEEELERIFSGTGLLSERLSGFEYRQEQARMAGAVLDALAGEETLIVEAGTGVGKSLAYLIPLCIWLSGQDNPKAIVTTFSKALQKQLFEKELPFIKRTLFPQLRYALSFGSDNYACLRRMAQSRQYGLFEAAENESAALIAEWLKTTATGLRAEIQVETATWQKIRREPDLCTGKECRFSSECFYQTAKAVERKSNIIIANHHLFFSHVAANYSVLPETRCVIFDEAHELEGVASDHLCVEVSNSALRYALDAVISPRGKGLILRMKWLDTGQVQEVSSLVDRARRTGDRFFSELQGALGNRRSMKAAGIRIGTEGEFSEALEQVHSYLDRLSSLSGDEEEEKEILAVAQRIRAFRGALMDLVHQEIEDHVYWASQDGRTVRLTATPLSISEVIRQRVFEVFSPAILTSATLSANNSFEFIRNRLGLASARTSLFNSPFEFRKQAKLYIPEKMPEPNHPGYVEAIAAEVNNLLGLSKGGSLVLFTSYSMMNDVAERISIGYPVLKQGDADNFVLLEEFRNSQPAALFGTYAFWQGIDLQGELLRCVIITKLPFSVPTDPVLEARLAQMAGRGKDPFSDYQVPSAAIVFKQGFGRLIRSKTDRGIVAVLDSRVIRKQYGRFFLNSLPDVGITNNPADLERFLSFPENLVAKT